MVTDTQKQKVFHIIDTMEDEIIRTVSDLVRIRSVNPGYPGVNYDEEIGGETEANTYLKQKYEQLDLEVDLWEEKASPMACRCHF